MRAKFRGKNMGIQISLSRHGYVLTTEYTGNPEHAAKELCDIASALDGELVDRFGGDAWPGSGKQPAKLRAESSDALLAWISEQSAARSQRYIKENCSVMSNLATGRALKELLRVGKLELRPTTYRNSAGKDRPMQGVYLAGSPLLSDTKSE